MVHFRLKFVVWISIFFEEGDLQHLIFDNISETFSRIFRQNEWNTAFKEWKNSISLDFTGKNMVKNQNLYEGKKIW